MCTNLSFERAAVPPYFCVPLSSLADEKRQKAVETKKTVEKEISGRKIRGKGEEESETEESEEDEDQKNKKTKGVKAKNKEEDEKRELKERKIKVLPTFRARRGPPIPTDSGMYHGIYYRTR